MNKFFLVALASLSLVAPVSAGDLVASEAKENSDLVKKIQACIDAAKSNTFMPKKDQSRFPMTPKKEIVY